jgi:hypothetical protein
MIFPAQNAGLDIALVLCPGWGVTQPPVGISYLKSYLSANGYKAQCIDLSLELYKQFEEKKYWDLNYPQFFIEPELFEDYILPRLAQPIARWAKHILALPAETIGFSLYMSNLLVSNLLALKLKQLKPGIKIIGGGPEVTRIKRVFSGQRLWSAPITIDIFKAFDVLIEGEGEQTLTEWLSKQKQQLKQPDTKGLMFEQQGKVTINKPRPLLSDLEPVNIPDFSDFLLDEYQVPVLPVVTSRGCVNHCSFCADSPLWKTYRTVSAEKTVEALEVLAGKHQINNFEIVDSVFNGSIKRLEMICDRIIDRSLDIRWSAKACLNRAMDIALLNKMKKSGCQSLSYGLESGSETVLKSMRKNIDLKQAQRIIKQTKQAGIQANCFFIIGYPTETEQDFQKTLDFISRNAKYIDRFDQVTGCHIEEDSYLGRNLDKFGIEFRPDGWYCRGNTPEVRKQRLQRFKEHAQRLHKHYVCQVQQ